MRLDRSLDCSGIYHFQSFGASGTLPAMAKRRRSSCAGRGTELEWRLDEYNAGSREVQGTGCVKRRRTLSYGKRDGIIRE
ncbi:MAG: hypothetical protein H7836_15570 [Magnetococcus sp. YQC-3]